MTTVKQYVVALRQREEVIARKMGCLTSQEQKGARILNLSLLVLLSVLIKTLVDKGVITDAELVATLQTAADDIWPDEGPIVPPPTP